MGEEKKKIEEENKLGEEKEKVVDNKESGGGIEAKKEDEKERKVEQADPTPPPPEEVVMKVYMHCEGCARKVKRCLQRLEGVESVVADCRTHRVVLKGRKAAENPMRVVERVERKCSRKVELISPIPPPEAEKKEEEIKVEEPKPALVEPQVITVVLRVYMHCKACSQEIKKRILKIKGVLEVEPDLKKSEVTVKGVFEPEKLAEYVHKRTGKYALLVKQELPPEPEKNSTEEEKKVEQEAAAVEKKPEGEAELVEKKSEDGKADSEDKKKDESRNKGEEKELKEKEKDKESGADNGGAEAPPAVIAPAVVDSAAEAPPAVIAPAVVDSAGKVMRKTDFYYYYTRYPVDHSYPSQILSDENPNACTIV